MREESLSRVRQRAARREVIATHLLGKYGSRSSAAHALVQHHQGRSKR